jgi:hypothetical protein
LGLNQHAPRRAAHATPGAGTGYGSQPAAIEPLWVQSAAIQPLVTLHAHDENGNPVDLTGTLETFLPFARQVVALYESMPQAALCDHEYYPDQQQQAG